MRHLETVFSFPDLSISLVTIAVDSLLRVGSTSTASPKVKTACKELISILRERHSSIVDSAYVAFPSSPGVKQDLMEQPDSQRAFLDVYSADVSARVQGVGAIMTLISNKMEVDGTDLDTKDAPSARDALAMCLADKDDNVVFAVYDHPEILYHAIGLGEKYIDAVAAAFMKATPCRPILRYHLNYMSDDRFGIEEGFVRQAFERLIFPCSLNTLNHQSFERQEWDTILDGRLGSCDALITLKQELSRLKDGDTETQYHVALVNGLAGMSSVLLAFTCR